MDAKIAGFGLTGWAWLLMLAVSVYYFLTVKATRSFPLRFWIPWLVYLVVWLAADFSFFGVQLTLQYMLPIIVGVVASSFTYDKEKLHWLYKKMFLLCLVLVLLFAYGILFYKGYTPYAAYTPMLLSVMAAVSMGAFYLSKKARFFGVYAVLFLIPFLDVTRMALLVFLVILILHFANRNILSKISFAVAGIILAIFVFNTQAFQEKTFFQGKGELTDLQSNLNYYDESNSVFNTSGRSQFYRYYEPGLKASPLVGNGPRADLYLLEKVVGGSGVSEAHNDYLSVLYNYGNIGLGLLLFGFIPTFLSLYGRFLNEKNQYRILLQTSAMILTVTFLMSMYSDNMLKSTVFFADFYFVLIGMAYAPYDDKT
ncbi:MAG: O-antigen ligase family protein [Chlorobium sp.]|uniref:O-antigen ligase family protein n=1 Tax=Chlorobium sp. TaxID=1095 RepID=UPI0025BCC316|nr:O-antigen ligase family protein [Chlorobium sp.]MCF8383428.1 O-antigen ligase family protein [Chlorobium sp.]